jgi:chemotaxis signal transduction protein
MGADINSMFVNGMGGRDDGFIVILDVDQLFAADVADSFQGTHEIDTTIVPLRAWTS